MSLRKGAREKGPPKHQNSFAFKHNPSSKKTEKILSIKHAHLCKRCKDKIEWKKKYRKYKPIKRLAKCNACSELRINRAYHTLCDSCAILKNVCAMCATPKEESFGATSAKAKKDENDMENEDEIGGDSDEFDDQEEEEEEDAAMIDKKEKEFEKFLSSLTERRRRTLRRKYERDSKFAFIADNFVHFPSSLNDILEKQKESERFFQLLKSSNLDSSIIPSGKCVLQSITRLADISTEPDKNATAGSIKISYSRSKIVNKVAETEIVSIPMFLKFQTGRGMPLWLQALRAAAEPGVMREVDFYKNLSTSVPLRTPKMYLAEKSPQFNRILLALEYFDIENVLNSTESNNIESAKVITDTEGASLHQVLLMLTNVAKMHAMFYGRTKLDLRTSWIPAKSGLEYCSFVKSFMNKNNPIWTLELWTALENYFRGYKVTLVHGDCRPGNMIFLDNDKDVVFGDWEATNVAPLLWDFTYCTTLGWSSATRTKNLEKALESYLNSFKKAAEENGIDVFAYSSFDDAKLDVEILLLVLGYVSMTIRKGGYWRNQGNTSSDQIAWHMRISLAISKIDCASIANALKVKEDLILRLKSNAEYDAKETFDIGLGPSKLLFEGKAMEDW